MTSTVIDRAAPAREWGFLAANAGVFIAAAGATVWLCRRPECCTTIPMPGGWGMSTVWTGMPGQIWTAAFGSFLGMWVVMMVAMMLPSLVPVLLGFRGKHNQTSPLRLAGETITLAAGYFFLWMIFGSVLYPIGALWARALMQSESMSRAMPVAAGMILLLAALNQFAPWKSRQLGCCRDATSCGGPGGPGAWRIGLRLGGHCVLCCLGFMLTLVAVGVMDLTAMLVVTAAITLERLAPNPLRAARITGTMMMAWGVIALTR